MSKYRRQATSAAGLLKRKGQPVTLHRVTLPNYDPLAPTSTQPVAAMQLEAFAVVLPATNATISAFDDKLLTDPRRRQSFRYVLMSGVTLKGESIAFEPRADDILQTGEGPYRLLGASPLNVDGETNILWRLGCTLDVALTNIPEAGALLDGELSTGDELL